MAKQAWHWLGLSLAVSLYFGVVTLLYVHRQPNIVQDDARQHVAFLQRFVNPELFSKDLIADYFTTVAPVGYKAVYWLGAKLGIAPLTLAQFLPLLLSLITTVYLFQVCLKLLPLPLAGFLATLILNQQLWLNDDLVSATPRAFVYPIFAAFLDYLLSESLLLCLLTIGLQGLFFPQLVLVQVWVLLLRFRKSNWQLTLCGVLTAALVLLPSALDSTWGASITAAQMRTMPEYGWQGRNQYFGVGWQFWLLGNSGIRVPLFPSLILAGFGLPLLGRPFWRRRLPLVGAIRAEVRLLWQVLLASLIMYGLAHLLLLRLHFPSRYTYHTLRIILAIAAGIVWASLIDAVWRWLRQVRSSQLRLTIPHKICLGLTALFTITVLTVPAIPQVLLQFQGWEIGNASAIYQYLREQPPNVRIASLAPEANNLPALTQRSVLAGREFALPHHPQYYSQFQQQAIDSIQIQYTFDRSELIQLLEANQVNFVLLDRNSFWPEYLYQQDWLIHSSFQSTVLDAIHSLQQGSQSIVAQSLNRCRVTADGQLILLDATCLKTP